jgi:hypothetical protein
MGKGRLTLLSPQSPQMSHFSLDALLLIRNGHQRFCHLCPVDLKLSQSVEELLPSCQMEQGDGEKTGETSKTWPLPCYGALLRLPAHLALSVQDRVCLPCLGTAELCCILVPRHRQHLLPKELQLLVFSSHSTLHTWLPTVTQ